MSGRVYGSNMNSVMGYGELLGEGSEMDLWSVWCDFYECLRVINFCIKIIPAYKIVVVNSR